MNDADTTEERVEFIAAMMRELTFVRGETHKVLAERWGLAPNSVRKLTAEASRRVKAEITDRDEVTVDVCGTLALIMREGRQGDHNDVRNAIQAAKTWAEISGITAPQKHEVTGANGAPIGLPAHLVPLWPKAESGDPDALAAIQRWVSGDAAGEGEG